MLREWASIIAKPISITFEKLWQSKETPSNWRTANTTPTFKKDRRKDL